jgi:hypothetical protein
LGVHAKARNRATEIKSIAGGYPVHHVKVEPQSPVHGLASHPHPQRPMRRHRHSDICTAATVIFWFNQSVLSLDCFVLQ